jgi:hypothetical protein
MKTIQQLENSVRQLSAEELAIFRAWFAEFDAEQRDGHFEAAVSAGRLIGWSREHAEICVRGVVRTDESPGFAALLVVLPPAASRNPASGRPQL